MKVDCYNACSLPIDYVAIGDVFYFNDVLYLKVTTEQIPMTDRMQLAVDLSRGVVTSFDSDTIVTKAEARVVCE